MWLLEKSLREWQSAGGHPWALAELIAECKRRPVPNTVVNVDAAELIFPSHMLSKINRELEKAGHQPVPEEAECAPQMADVIFANLAARYAKVLRALPQVTGLGFRRLYVVDGGSQNNYLNRLIAERAGLEVMRGPVESSTIGNLAIQFAALESGSAGATPADVARWAARMGRSSST
jgi:rhamnulokinase